MENNQQPQRTVTVDGKKFIVQFYPPTFGLTLWARLFRLLGQPLVTMIDAVGRDKVEGKDGAPKRGLMQKIADLNWNDVNTDQLGRSMMMLFSGIKDEEVSPLIQDILSQTFYAETRQCVTETFESEFAGKYMTIFRLTGRTLAEQYADFWQGIVKQSRAAMPVSDSEKPYKSGLRTELSTVKT